MTPHRREAEYIRNLKQAAKAGEQLLRQHPDYPRVELEAIEESEAALASANLPVPALPSPQRLEYAINIMNIWAGKFVQLIRDLKERDAFISYLGGLERHAWETYSGVVGIEPIPGNRELKAIRERVIHWRKESNRRLIPAERPAPRTPEHPVEPVSAWGRVSAPSSEDSANETMPRKPVRLPGYVQSLQAAQKMETFLREKNILQKDFAIAVNCNERTLRRFRKTGRIRLGTLLAIAKQMKMTTEEIQH